VATRSGGLTDVVVDGETGLLVDVGDIAGAADRLVRLAGDAKLRARLGAGARAHMQANYSLTSTTDRVEEIYRAAVQ
jgi:glycosyltransferase involved in cell wall biosynthesis